ncbi:hypothetical protein POM88_004639 [Heracleum sosnowskyi]|uniref:Uncharacterized protein n=1 Tax=Heracleum sosnowskyi TaxID=360622 RepID=A0AAD8NCR0_9APIA|nr:hypothetical protein POM88_004639 [Heracleum sosnowskyi]
MGMFWRCHGGKKTFCSKNSKGGLNSVNFSKLVVLVPPYLCQGICEKGGTCSSGSGIQGDFNLNNFEDGVISSAFMVGLLLASPIFASLAHMVNPFRLIGVGLTVWAVAVVGCGISFNFWSIAVCRMLVGVGEASSSFQKDDINSNSKPYSAFLPFHCIDEIAESMMAFYTNYKDTGLFGVYVAAEE